MRPLTPFVYPDFTQELVLRCARDSGGAEVRRELCVPSARQIRVSFARTSSDGLGATPGSAGDGCKPGLRQAKPVPETVGRARGHRIRDG